MKDHQITDLKSLINLPTGGLEKLIAIIKLHDGQTNLSDLMIGQSEDQKIKILITELAGKLCRCIDKIDSQKYQISQRIAICISRIFNSKGITISRFHCDPVPMLIPKTGQTSVIRSYTRVN